MINFRLFCCQGESSIPAERRGRGVSKTRTPTFLPSLSTLTWRVLAISSFSLSHGAFLCVPSLLCTESSVGTSRQAPYPHPDLFPCAEPVAVFHGLSSRFTDALSLERTCSLVPTRVHPVRPRRVSVPVCPVRRFCPLGLSCVFGGFLGSPALTSTSHSPAFS